MNQTIQTTTASNASQKFDYSELSVAERLLLAQELLDSVYDDMTPVPLAFGPRPRVLTTTAAAA